jgi:hypothetical protein
MLPRQVPQATVPSVPSRKSSIDGCDLPPVIKAPSQEPIRLADLKEEIRQTRNELEQKKKEAAEKFGGLETKSWEELVMQHIELRLCVEHLQAEIAAKKRT